MKSFLLRGLACGAGMLGLSAIVAVYVGIVRYGLPLTTVFEFHPGDQVFLARLIPLELAAAFALIACYDLAKLLDARLRTWRQGRRSAGRS